MTLDHTIKTLGLILQDDFPDDALNEHKALLTAIRVISAVQRLKEILDSCGDHYKTIP